MKFSHLATVAAVAAFAGGAAQAQPPAAPTPGSVTGDWNDIEIRFLKLL